MLESLDCRGFVCVVSVFTGLSPWESGVALGSDKMNKNLNAEKISHYEQHERRERFEFISFRDRRGRRGKSLGAMLVIDVFQVI